MDKKSKYQYGEIAIVVSCQKGDRHIEKTYLECTSTGVWNDTVPTCEEITCQPFILDNSVHASIQPDLNKYNVSTRITLSCIPGYIGPDTFTVCKADGQWSSQQTPNCTPSDCKTLIVGVNVKPSKQLHKFNDEVTLSCEIGYIGDPISIKCYSNGSWPIHRLNCKPANCDDLNVGAYVKPSKQQHKYNDNVTLSCEEGYFGVPISIKCYANGSWPTDRPNCKPITCSMLTVNDRIMKSDNISKFNDNVTLSCKQGYIRSSVILKCNATGFWPSQRPNCIAANCDDLNVGAYVKPSKQQHKYNDNVTLSCEEGYFGVPISIKCYANGSWPTDRPNCKPITCSMLTVNDRIMKSDNISKFNDNVTLSCKQGYIRSSVILKCNATGFWPSQRPNCIAANCDDLNVGAYVKPSKQQHKYNDNVTLSCEEGYFGVPISIKCYANGSWPTDRPNCKPITCSMLTVNDRIMKSDNISKFNDNVTLSCKQGYIRSSVILKCNATGFWPSQRPNCIAVTCRALRPLPHQKLEPDQMVSSYRDNITFKCDDGYELTTEYTMVTCQSDGTWSNKQPNCTGVPCPHLQHIYKALLKNPPKEYRYPDALTVTCETGYLVESSNQLQCNSSRLWNSIPQFTCIEKSLSYKDSLKKRGKCISYGLFGGILAAIVSISAGGHIATCFYYRKQAGKSAAVYEDMKFNTVERQIPSNEDTYSELT